MNWNAWNSIIDNSIIFIAAICIIWLICAIWVKFSKDNKSENTPTQRTLKPGERATVVIKDPMIIEKIKVYQERQELYNQQIATYNEVINGIDEELQTLKNALTNGSVSGTYDKLKRREGVLIKRKADYKIRINLMIERSDNLTEKIQELARKYGVEE